MIGSIVGVAGGAALLLGLALASIGLLGMLRRPAIFEQLHAAGLITGPGVILVLLASLASLSAEIATSGVLVVAFILITSSLSTHAIALAAWRPRPTATPGQDAVNIQEPRADTGRAARSSGAMRVLLAHDGSPGADVATTLVASLPWAEGSEIRVIGAIEGDLQPVSASESARESPRPSVDVEAALAAVTDRLHRPGLTVDHVVRRGDPATAIATEAEAVEADLVVVGSRGLGPIQALFLGSVASAVVDAAPCAVLVARVPRVREVLLATDGSGSSDVAIEVVGGWPVFEGMTIRVLSVATSFPQAGDLQTAGTLLERVAMREQLKVAGAAARRLRDAGTRAVPYARRGDAAAGILAFAQDGRIDLIVLGSRGRTGLRRALLGSVGRDVLAAAKVSVLVVKAADG